MFLRAIFLLGITNGIAVCTTGCASDRDYKTLTTQVPEYGLESYYDKSKGVTCYTVTDKDNLAMSCVKTKKTE